MSDLKCRKCGSEASTNDEFISGKCHWCGSELEEEDEFELNDLYRGRDSDLD